MINAMSILREDFATHNFEPVVVPMTQTLSAKELKSLLPSVDGWIIGDDLVTDEVLAAGHRGKLKAAVKWGVGVDNVDFESAKKHNIPIKNTPGVFNDEVADLAIGYMISLARQTHFIDREVRIGNWPKPMGTSLKGKTLALLGVGNIGSEIAKRAIVFGLNVIGYDPNAKHEPPPGVVMKTWPESLNEVDFFIISASLNDGNRWIVNKQTIELMKKGVRLINVSRGGLVKESDLIEALRSGHIESVALDVFEEEPPNHTNDLFCHSRSIFGSHNASNTSEAVMITSKLSIKILRSLINENS
jgi:D-3-phosphoglycerate dehydrogenase